MVLEDAHAVADAVCVQQFDGVPDVAARAALGLARVDGHGKALGLAIRTDEGKPHRQPVVGQVIEEVRLLFIAVQPVAVFLNRLDALQQANQATAMGNPLGALDAFQDGGVGVGLQAIMRIAQKLGAYRNSRIRTPLAPCPHSTVGHALDHLGRIEQIPVPEENVEQRRGLPRALSESRGGIAHRPRRPLACSSP